MKKEKAIITNQTIDNEVKKNKYPKYSVLMSVYYKENPEWFDQSIKCMFEQTIKPSEFVLVEDGPLTNELYEIVKKYKTEHDASLKVSFKGRS